MMRMPRGEMWLPPGPVMVPSARTQAWGQGATRLGLGAMGGRAADCAAAGGCALWAVGPPFPTMYLVWAWFRPGP